MRRLGRSTATATAAVRLPARSRREAAAPSNAALAVSEWLRSLRLSAAARSRWFAEIVLDVAEAPPEQAWNASQDSRFHLYLYPSEWSFFFCHAGRASWIRVGDRPLVHGRDEHGLALSTPPLSEIGRFLGNLEAKHDITFRRDLALVRTNVEGAEPAVRRWLTALQ